MVEVAQKVFNNREDPTAGLNTRMAKVLLALNEKKKAQEVRETTRAKKSLVGEKESNPGLGKISVHFAERKDIGNRNALKVRGNRLPCW